MTALWIDHHRPRHLSELSIQPVANDILKNISSSFSFPHLLFCGPPGSGKKTRVLAFLRELFHTDFHRLRSEYRTITEGDKNVEIQVVSSDYHVELTPADAGNNDKRVISFFLKEIAASQCVGNYPVKVIVINEAHRLSKLAQQALRRTMEKYARTCRLILVADSLTQIMEPVRSRCLIVRTPRVPRQDIKDVLCQISAMESFQVEDNLLNQVVDESDGNLRRGINILESLSLKKKSGNISSVIPEWEKYTDDLCKIIIEEQLSPDTMKKIRVHLYELLVHCVPPTEIFRRLLKGMMNRVDLTLGPKICTAAAEYEARMRSGSKPIFHLEAFVARFICIYKEYLAEISG